MVKNQVKIAIASSDGIVVNSHFGRAKDFYIYIMEEDGHIVFLEKRSVEPVCEGGNHDDVRLGKNMSAISDCSYLLVSRIGNGAAFIAESFGIDCYEIPGIIEESVEQLVKFIKLKQLFQ